MNANVFNRSGQKLGLIADFVFETSKGKIQFSGTFISAMLFLLESN